MSPVSTQYISPLQLIKCKTIARKISKSDIRRKLNSTFIREKGTDFSRLHELMNLFKKCKPRILNIHVSDLRFKQVANSQEAIIRYSPFTRTVHVTSRFLKNMDKFNSVKEVERVMFKINQNTTYERHVTTNFLF